MTVANFKLNLDDITVLIPSSPSIVETLIICNTGTALTLSVYTKVILSGSIYYIVDGIALAANSTFIYSMLRVPVGSELHVESPDGTADMTLSFTPYA